MGTICTKTPAPDAVKSREPTKAPHAKKSQEHINVPAVKPDDVSVNKGETVTVSDINVEKEKHESTAEEEAVQTKQPTPQPPTRSPQLSTLSPQQPTRSQQPSTPQPPTPQTPTSQPPTPQPPTRSPQPSTSQPSTPQPSTQEPEPWLAILNKIADLDLWPGSRRHERTEWRDYLLKADELANKPRQDIPLNTRVAVYSGNLDVTDLPTLNNKVKVFVSSTFTDTKAERNVLMRDVYPYLRDVCRRLGLDFGTSDMRWGVTDEATNTHSTTKICTDEIKRCIRESCGPSFLCFLSHKYGFRPLPTTIEESEYDVILAYLINNSKDTNLLKKLYKLDKNYIEHEYVLQSIDKNDKTVWEEMEQLHGQLRETVTECFPNKPKICDKYFISVTETEIRTGAFDNNKSDEQVFIIIRDLKDILSDFHKSRRLIDMKGEAVREDAQERLDILKSKSVPKHINEDQLYNITYDKDYIEGANDSIRTACDQICKRLIDMVFTSYARYQTYVIDSTFSEALQHLVIAKEKRATFVGKEKELKTIVKYLCSRSDLATKPLVLQGNSGCGKTSLMAMSALKAKESVKTGVVITRFIGTTSQSGTVRDLLVSISRQIRQVYFSDLTKVPDSLTDLVTYFHESLKLATKTTPLVIVLDSLDQLSSDDNGRKLDWLLLDNDLPAHVKVILSTLPVDTFNIIEKHIPAGNMVPVRKLLPGEGPVIFKEMLKKEGRTVTASQLDVIMNAFIQCPLPLYLRLAADMSLKWKSFDDVDETKIRADTQGMIELTFERLESKYGHSLVSYALGYITAAKHGLAQSELEDILSCNEQVLDDLFKYWTPPMRRIPPLLWARVRDDLGEYLVERGTDGVVAYNWYHRQFYETARDRYLHSPKGTDGQVGKSLHEDIADYFEGKWMNGKPGGVKQETGKLENRGVPAQPLVVGCTRSGRQQLNRRKLSELPHQLIQSLDWDRFSKLVLNLEYLEAKFKAGMGHECYRELTEAARLSNDVTLTKIVRFIGPNISFLIREPSVLYQLVSQQQKGHPLRQQLEQMMENASVPMALVRNIYDSTDGGDDPCLLTLQGHSKAVQTCVFSPQGDCLVSTGQEGSLRRWDVLTGATLSVNTCLPGPPPGCGYILTYPLNMCCYSRDGGTIVTGTADGDVIVWDNEGTKVKTVPTDHAVVSSVQFSPDNKTLALGFTDCRVSFWDAKTFGLIASIEMPPEVAGVDFSPDGKYLAVAARDVLSVVDVSKHIIAWQARDKPAHNESKRTRGRRVSQHVLLCCCYHPDGNQILTGAADSHIGVWDVAEGVCNQKLSDHSAWVWSIKITRDGRYMFSASSDRSIKVWHYFKYWSIVSTIHGHSHRVLMLALDPLDEKLASASLDCSVKVWDVNALKQHKSRDQPEQMNHETLPYNTLAISPNREQIAVSLGWACDCEVRSFTESEATPAETENTPTELQFETNEGHPSKWKKRGFVRSGEFTLDGSGIVVLDHGHRGDYPIIKEHDVAVHNNQDILTTSTKDTSTSTPETETTEVEESSATVIQVHSADIQHDLHEVDDVDPPDLSTEFTVTTNTCTSNSTSTELMEGEKMKQKVEDTCTCSSKQRKVEVRHKLVQVNSSVGVKVKRSSKRTQTNPKLVTKETQYCQNDVGDSMNKIEEQAQLFHSTPNKPSCPVQLEPLSLNSSTMTFLDDNNNDPDYRPDMEDTVASEQESFTEKSPREQKKYLVFEENLLELFQTCPSCMMATSAEVCNTQGTSIAVYQECSCGYERKWESQPRVGNTAAGNILLSAAMLFAGCCPSKVFRMLGFLNVVCTSIDTFWRHQRTILWPAIDKVWNSYQHTLFQCLRSRGGDIVVAGDGRADSPGHSAKFGAYSMIDLQSGRVIQVQLVQSNEVKSSYHMELEGLKRSVHTLQTERIHILELITDRHLQIQKWIRENMPSTKHSFDVWHIAKGLKKKLLGVSKERDCHVATRWIKSITNHMYWSAASTTDGDQDLVLSKWKSIANHIQNVHNGHEGKFHECEHDTLLNREWLKPGFVENVYKDTDVVIMAHCAEHGADGISTTALMAGNPTVIEAMMKDHEEHVMDVFKTIDHLANKHNIKHTLERLHGPPGDAIVKAAATQDVDLIIAGSRGHGTVRRTIMGSVSDYIVHHSHVPVLICKHEDEHHKLNPK